MNPSKQDKVTTNLPGSCGDVFTTSPAVAATSPRRLLSCGDVATSPAVSLVSSRSRRRRGDVSPVADKISLRDVVATDGDVAETSPRPAGDWKKSPKIEHV